MVAFHSRPDPLAQVLSLWAAAVRSKDDVFELVSKDRLKYFPSEFFDDLVECVEEAVEEQRQSLLLPLPTSGTDSFSHKMPDEGSFASRAITNAKKLKLEPGATAPAVSVLTSSASSFSCESNSPSVAGSPRTGRLGGGSGWRKVTRAKRAMKTSKELISFGSSAGSVSASCSSAKASSSRETPLGSKGRLSAFSCCSTKVKLPSPGGRGGVDAHQLGQNRKGTQDIDVV